METCRNCGAELPPNARFCPNCAAPVDREDSNAEGPGPTGTARRRIERVAFAILVALIAALLVLALLVFVFGVFVED